MIVSDIDQLGLVLAVVMYRRIVGEQHLMLLQLGIGDRNCRDQRTGVRMHRIVEKLLCVCDLNDITLINNADTVGVKRCYLKRICLGSEYTVLGRALVRFLSTI